MSHAYVFGLIGPTCDQGTRKMWNGLLKKSGVNGFFDFYHTVTVRELELRFSEMFLHGRRGYIIHSSLAHDAICLMDSTDRGVSEGGVYIVKNNNGILTGYGFDYFFDNNEILNLWLKN